jgi:hypothetical protein
LLRVEFIALLAFFRVHFGLREVTLFDKIPNEYSKNIPKDITSKSKAFYIRCASGRGMKVGRNYLGFICLQDDSLFFITRKRFQMCRFDIDMSKVDELKFEKRLLFDYLIFRRGRKKSFLYLFKSWQNRGEKVVGLLEILRQKKINALLSAIEIGKS